MFWSHWAAWGGSSSVALIVIVAFADMASLYSPQPVVASSLYKVVVNWGMSMYVYPQNYRYQNRTVINYTITALNPLEGFCLNVVSAYFAPAVFEHRGRRAIWGKDSRPASECRSLQENCRRIVTRLEHAISCDSTSSTPALMYLAAWAITCGFAALNIPFILSKPQFAFGNIYNFVS